MSDRAVMVAAASGAVIPAEAGIQRLSPDDTGSPASGQASPIPTSVGRPGQSLGDAPFGPWLRPPRFWRPPRGRQAGSRGWLAANKWLLLRRATQLAILALFLLGPFAGVWIVRGNLSASTTLGVLPLADPFVVLQSLVAGTIPYATALTGAAIVVGFYLVVGGRAYCAWVCPVNVVTDAAAWLRRRLGLRNARTPSAATRYWLLGATLVAAFTTGTLAWEFVNPVSMLHRALIFGGGLAWTLVIAVLAFDLAVARRGFCGHVCPQGALYALIGRLSLVRVSAHRRRDCDDCGECYAVCPEPAVIAPALKPRDPASSPIIAAGACTNCGRCLDVCRKDVFRFTLRFDRRSEACVPSPD